MSARTKKSHEMSKTVKQKSSKTREVPAFTVQSGQKNTKVLPPPATKVQEPQKTSSRASSSFTDSCRVNGSASSPDSSVCYPFRSAYERGELPVKIEHQAQGIKLAWKIPFEDLNYALYLQLFFEALIEMKNPYRFVAEQGAADMIENGTAEQIMPKLVFLIQPMRRVLHTKDPEKMCMILKIIQRLVTRIEPAGPALVPYYRQLLPILGIFRAKNANIGDKIEYGQRHKQNLGDLIQDTLEVLETHGGQTAFINIQYIIPTYQSCLGNR